MHIWCSVIFCLMVSARYVDAAIDTDCSTNGDDDCDATNNEVCDGTTGVSDKCICDTGYTDNSGTCDLVVCPAVTNPANGATALDSDGVLTYQATATVTCDEGYEVSDGVATATITCQADGSWTALPTCSKKDCGNVADPANVDTIVYSGGATTYESTATVTCDDESTQTLTCESTGSWSAVPTCPGCGDPSAPDDATVALDAADTTDPNATATVTCDDGYEVSTGVATATITCQDDGSWTDLPTCTAKGSTSVAWSFYVLLLLGVMTRLME